VGAPFRGLMANLIDRIICLVAALSLQLQAAAAQVYYLRGLALQLSGTQLQQLRMDSVEAVLAALPRLAGAAAWCDGHPGVFARMEYAAAEQALRFCDPCVRDCRTFAY